MTNIKKGMTHHDFRAEIKDICKFDDYQPFTVKWLDEEGRVSFPSVYVCLCVSVCVCVCVCAFRCVCVGFSAKLDWAVIMQCVVCLLHVFLSKCLFWPVAYMCVCVCVCVCVFA